MLNRKKKENPSNPNMFRYTVKPDLTRRLRGPSDLKTLLVVSH